METLEQIKARAEATVADAKIEIIANPGPASQPSLLIDNDHAVAVARFLRDDPALRFDLCSNVTGVDWLDRTVKKTSKVKQLVDGVEKEVSETTEEFFPGYLEAIYHLYSVTHQTWTGDHSAADEAIARLARACRRSLRSGAAQNFRSGKFSISTASALMAIPICDAF